MYFCASQRIGKWEIRTFSPQTHFSFDSVSVYQKDKYLRKFIQAFVPEDDEFMFRLQKALLTGLNMDYRRPVLLQEKDVENFTNPVYVMVSDNDIFFPGLEAIERAKKVFKNFKEAHIIR